MGFTILLMNGGAGVRTIAKAAALAASLCACSQQPEVKTAAPIWDHPPDMYVACESGQRVIYVYHYDGKPTTRQVIGAPCDAGTRPT